jgi:predicted deacetylase
MLKYIIRLDDACPTMDWKKWNKIFKIFNKYDIKPIIAVIPNNEDKKMKIDKYNNNFWNEVKNWENKGYYIAMHGDNHKYISKNSGLIPMNNQSEFAGIDIKIQRKKIKKSWEIFKKQAIIPNIWVAPSHTFDKNTLKVLKEETDIKIISDGIAIYPYNKDGFFWIPQQMWKYKEKKDGIWTICLHPNTMNNKEIENLEIIIKNNVEKFKINLNELYEKYKNRELSLNDKIYFKLFFLKRNFYKTRFFKFLYKILKG